MANVLQGELIFSEETKQEILHYAFNKASGGGLYVSIGQDNSTKKGDSVKININKEGNGIEKIGDPVYFLADGGSINVNYLFLGSNGSTNFKSIATLTLSNEEKVTIQDGDAFMLSGLQILL